MLKLAVESWIWYGFVVAVTIARLTSRTLLFRGDVRKLQADDWLMLFVLSTYTTFVVTINIVADSSSNLLPPGYDVSKLTAAEVAHREYGSKMVLVVEQCQCFTIWTVKACLLIMYYRLFVALKEAFVVKILAVYVTFSFIFMEVFYLCVWCRPFHNYWAVPTPNTQCSAATNHLITNAVFNISSDLIMLTMALQMLIRSRLPLKRKLILCCIFGIGIFVILSAVLNKYYSFTNPYGSLWTFWYVRESSTAIIVANLPFTWALLRRVFSLDNFNPYASTTNHGGDGSIGYHSQRAARGRVPRIQIHHGVNPNGVRASQASRGITGFRTPSPGVGSGRKNSNSSKSSQSNSAASSSKNPRDSHVSRFGDLEPGSARPMLGIMTPTNWRDPKPPTPSWKDRELYGRMDKEALELWDVESEIGVESPMKAFFEQGRRRSDEINGHER